MNFQYYVVKLLSNPHPTVPEHVTVPASWIRSVSPDKRVAVSYPAERLQATVGRIVAAEPYDQEWKILMSDMKFGCDDFNEAQKCAKGLNKKKRSHFVPSNKNNQEFVKPNKIPKRKTMKRAASVDNAPSQEESKDKQTTPPQETTLSQDKERNETKIATEVAEVLKEMAVVFGTAMPILNDMFETAKTITNTLNNAASMANEFRNSTVSETDGAKEVPKHSYGASKDNEKTYAFPDNSDTTLKWTIRHKGPGEGLTELLPGSGVYVNAAKLMELETENNKKRAACELLDEIFCDHALSVCSLYGGNGKRHSGSSDIPPGLDKYSREVMFMYMTEYCHKRGWYLDLQWLKSTLRSQLSVHRKTRQAPY